MAQVDRTEAMQLWSKRIGGGYPTIDECERAAELLGEGHVLIGPPHSTLGYFIVPHPAPIKGENDGSR